MGTWAIFVVHAASVLGIVLAACVAWWLWLRPAEPRRRERPRLGRRVAAEPVAAKRPAGHAAGPAVDGAAPVYAQGGD